MDFLPDAISLEVFSFLTLREKCNNRAVCKAWGKLLQDFSLWTEIEVCLDARLASVITDDILALWLARSGCHVRLVRLRYCRKLTDKSCLIIAKHCRRIQVLDLQGCLGIGDLGIKYIAGVCRQIKKANFYMTGVSEVGCNELLKCAPTLTGLKLPNKGNCYRVLKCLTANCRALNELIIKDMIPLNADDPVVNDIAIKLITEALPMLSKLGLNWCWHITDESLRSVATNCKHLRHLGIAECHQITDYGIGQVINACPMLRKLHLGRLYGVTDGLSEYFKSKHLSLHSLKLIDTSVTDRGVSMILKQSPDMLKMSIGEYCFNAFKISGESVYSCAKYCKNILELSIVSSRFINDDMLKEIARNSFKLIALHISSCKDVTEVGIREICFGCPKLRELSLCKCVGFSDAALRHVIDSLKCLKYVEVYGCENITNTCVECLLKNRPKCRIKF